ncbi:ArsR/SmtB family transcription factor [Brachybacterium sp. DNPG3]
MNVELAAHPRLRAAELDRAAELFGALATTSRLRILLALGPQERTVSEIVGRTGLSQPLVSQHLKTLRGLRLVRVHRSGRQAYYAVDDAHVLSIVRDALDHIREDEAPDEH